MLRNVPAKANSSKTSEEEEVCLKWNSHHTNIKTTFPLLLEKEQYVDVTLCSEGKTLKCHRLVLSSCSSYFDTVLSGITPFQHPVIFLNTIPFKILKSLVDFMYTGEAYVENEKIQQILDVAEILKIKGLMKQVLPKNSGSPKPKAPSSAPSTPTTANTPQHGISPLRASLTPQQKTAIQNFDPLKLLKATFYEEKRPYQAGPLKNSLPMRHTFYKKLSSSNIIVPKKKYKRKSPDRDYSPPPSVLIPRGTRSRPIIKPPKLFQIESPKKHHPREPMHVRKVEPRELIQQKSPDPPQQPQTTLSDIIRVKKEIMSMEIDEELQKMDLLHSIGLGTLPVVKMVTATPAPNVNPEESNGPIKIKQERIDDDADELNVTDLEHEDPLTMVTAELAGDANSVS